MVSVISKDRIKIKMVQKGNVSSMLNPKSLLKRNFLKKSMTQHPYKRTRIHKNKTIFGDLALFVEPSPITPLDAPCVTALQEVLDTQARASF